MNALLCEMETTRDFGQCKHGRLTCVEPRLADIDRLYGQR
jgi:DNA mismatch repair ATPase MutL